MSRVASAVIGTLLVCTAASSASALSPQDQAAENAGRIVRLLEDSGYRYSKESQSAWSISFRGKNKDAITVFILADRDDVVLMARIADRAQLDNSAPALRALLRANATLPGDLYVLIDNNGNYDVQSRTPLKQVTSPLFKAALQAVANATDDVYASALKALGGAPPGAAAAGSGSSPELVVEFTAPRASTQEIALLNGKAALWINPRLWRETKSTVPTRRTFQHMKGDAYAMIIPERIELPIERLRQMAVDKFREAAPDMKILEEQHRRVNGTEILLLRMEGKVEGIPVTYLGYYYGGPAGTIQVVTYTSQSLFKEFRPDFEDYLNGFRVK